MHSFLETDLCLGKQVYKSLFYHSSWITYSENYNTMKSDDQLNDEMCKPDYKQAGSSPFLSGSQAVAQGCWRGFKKVYMVGGQAKFRNNEDKLSNYETTITYLVTRIWIFVWVVFERKLSVCLFQLSICGRGFHFQYIIVTCLLDHGGGTLTVSNKHYQQTLSPWCSWTQKLMMYHTFPLVNVTVFPRCSNADLKIKQLG